MPPANAFQIAVLPGDGIGPEVMAPCLDVLAAAERKVGGFSLSGASHPAGAAHYRDHGEALPKATLDACRRADAILLAAMGLPSVRYPDGTEIAPQIDLRFDLELYAGVRPVKTIPGLPPVLADPRAANLDFVLVRESTEGLFATRGKGAVVNDLAATETLVITRGVSERLFDFCFELARQRKARGRPGHVTCVDKANVFAAFAFFRKIFEERAAKFPDIGASSAYVDATALDMVRRPWTMDVLVTENMFGDILSDLGAGPDGRHGHGAVGRHRRCACRVPALPRHRARHRGPGQGQPDGDVPVGRHDAGVARHEAQLGECRAGRAPYRGGREPGLCGQATQAVRTRRAQTARARSLRRFWRALDQLKMPAA